MTYSQSVVKTWQNLLEYHVWPRVKLLLLFFIISIFSHCYHFVNRNEKFWKVFWNDRRNELIPLGFSEYEEICCSSSESLSGETLENCKFVGIVGLQGEIKTRFFFYLWPTQDSSLTEATYNLTESLLLKSQGIDYMFCVINIGKWWLKATTCYRRQWGGPLGSSYLALKSLDFVRKSQEQSHISSDILGESEISDKVVDLSISLGSGV